MRKCRTCGELHDNKFYCDNCRRLWKTKQLSAFNAAVAELGMPTTAEELAVLQKRVKQLKQKAEGEGA